MWCSIFMQDNKFPARLLKFSSSFSPSYSKLKTELVAFGLQGHSLKKQVEILPKTSGLNCSVFCFAVALEISYSDL